MCDKDTAGRTESVLEPTAPEEEIFLDAHTSPQLPPRRSARKRKSVTEPDAESVQKKAVGKRHRPLGTMVGVQRSPNQAGGQTSSQANSQKKTRPPERRTDPGHEKPPEMTIETDPPTDKPSKEQMILLGGMRAVLQDELNKTEARLSDRMKTVEDNYNGLRDDLNRLERRLDEVEQRPDKRQTQPVGEESFAFPCSSVRLGQSTAKEGRYWKARQSLRVWPIRGEGKAMTVALADFLQDKLLLEEDVVEQVNECKIRRIPNGRDVKIRFEVSVEFPSVEVRDAVRNAAFNLAGHADSGIRLEIPHHLMANFKALNNASYKLRQKFPGCKRNIKYDDEACDLVLDFRTGQASQWRTLTAGEAKKMAREDGGIDRISAADLSELLDGAGGREDEED